MRVTFTKCIYKDYEVDIPYKEFVEDFSESEHEAVLQYMFKANKINEEVEIDNIEIGKLDDEDQEYCDMLYNQDVEDDRLLNLQYEEGLL